MGDSKFLSHLMWNINANFLNSDAIKVENRWVTVAVTITGICRGGARGHTGTCALEMAGEIDSVVNVYTTGSRIEHRHSKIWNF